jgi:hypothetical protein
VTFLKRRPWVALVLVSLLAAVASAGAWGGTRVVPGCGATGHHRSGRDDACRPDAVPSPLRADLLAVAREAAQENHGVAGRAVAVVSTGANAARSIDGAAVSGGEKVWVVEISGHFTCGADCFVISAPAPTGTALTVDLDARTLTEVGLTLAPRWIDLSDLGPVHVLQPGG